MNIVPTVEPTSAGLPAPIELERRLWERFREEVLGPPPAVGTVGPTFTAGWMIGLWGSAREAARHLHERLFYSDPYFGTVHYLLTAASHTDGPSLGYTLYGKRDSGDRITGENRQKGES